MLAEVNLAEEGVLQLLLASIHRLSGRSGSDNEVAVSSRYVLLPGNIFVMTMNHANKLTS
jgi:spatacsin